MKQALAIILMMLTNTNAIAQGISIPIPDLDTTKDIGEISCSIHAADGSSVYAEDIDHKVFKLHPYKSSVFGGVAGALIQTKVGDVTVDITKFVLLVLTVKSQPSHMVGITLTGSTEGDTVRTKVEQNGKYMDVSCEIGSLIY